MTGCGAESCVHGLCVNGSCVCKSDWSGNVDILTQDLSFWGGSIIACVSHIPTLKILWIIALVCYLLILPLACKGVLQQWQKYKTLREQRLLTQNPLRHWFQYKPLLIIVVLCIGTIPSVFTLSVAKLASHNLRETIGVTPAATFGAALLTVVTPVAVNDHLNNVISLLRKSFAASDDAPFHALLGWVGTVSYVGCALFSFCGVYPIISAAVSPYSRRRVHLICFYLYFGQMTLSTLLMAFPAIVLTVKARVYMAGVIRARQESRNAAVIERTAEENNIAGLRQLRKKILRSLVLMSFAFIAQALVHGLCVVSSDLALQSSYWFVAKIIFSTMVMIFTLSSYTKLESLCIYSRASLPAFPEADSPAGHAI